MKKIIYFTFLLLCVFFTSCESSSEDEPTYNPGEEYSKVKCTSDAEFANLLAGDVWRIENSGTLNYRFKSTKTFSLTIYPIYIEREKKSIDIDGTWNIVSGHLHLKYNLNTLYSKGCSTAELNKYIAKFELSNSQLQQWQNNKTLDPTPTITFYQNNNDKSIRLHISDLDALYSNGHILFNNDAEAINYLKDKYWAWRSKDFYFSYKFRYNKTFSLTIKPEEYALDKCIDIEGTWDVVDSHLHLEYNLKTLTSLGYSESTVNDYIDFFNEENLKLNQWTKNRSEDKTSTIISFQNQSLRISNLGSLTTKEIPLDSDELITERLIGNAWEYYSNTCFSYRFKADKTFDLYVKPRGLGVPEKIFIQGQWQIKDGHIHWLYSLSSMQSTGYTDNEINQFKEFFEQLNEQYNKSKNSSFLDNYTPTITYYANYSAQLFGFRISIFDYVFINVAR